MGYLDEMLERANLQSLREYLLYGADGEEHSMQSYEVRLKKAYEKCCNIVKTYDKDGEDSELLNVICQALAEYEHVYMELGIQAGVRLAKEIE